MAHGMPVGSDLGMLTGYAQGIEGHRGVSGGINRLSWYSAQVLHRRGGFVPGISRLWEFASRPWIMVMCLPSRSSQETQEEMERMVNQSKQEWLNAQSISIRPQSRNSLTMPSSLCRQQNANIVLVDPHEEFTIGTKGIFGKNAP